MLPYLKLFIEAGDDPKLLSLPAEQFRVWFRMLCYVARQPRRGTISGLPKELLSIQVSGGDLDLLIATCEALQSRQCLIWRYADPEENTLEIVFLNFEKRQSYSKPSNHPDRVAARVAKYRARKRSETVTPCNADVTRSVTPHVTPVTTCNAIVTPELDLNSESNSLSLGEKSPKSLGPNPAVRTGLDRDMLNQAVSVLAADLRTEHLAQQLNRQHNTAANLLISGLRWFRAANTIQGAAYSDDQRRSWPYFAGIASKIGEEERPQPPPRESTAERRTRERKAQIAAKIAQEASRNGSA